MFTNKLRKSRQTIKVVSNSNSKVNISDLASKDLLDKPLYISYNKIKALIIKVYTYLNPKLGTTLLTYIVI